MTSAIEEFDSDTEALSNTIGKNVPLRWYDRLPHVGYDLDARPIINVKKTNAIDAFLSRHEDPDHWRTVYDSLTGSRIVLTEEDVKLARSIASGASNLSNIDDFSEEWLPKCKTPLHSGPPSKRSFLPSIDEHRAIGKLVHAIRQGWLSADSIFSRDVVEAKRAPRSQTISHDLWSNEGASEVRNYLVAPKMSLPGHEDSYAPAPEYSKDGDTGHVCLRHVHSYDSFIEERFERCLDLYMCARKLNMRARFDPSELLAKATRDLPRAKDLRPFPMTCTRRYVGGKGNVTCMDVCVDRLVTASDRGEVRIYQIWNERCVYDCDSFDSVTSVAFNPSVKRVLAVADSSKIHVMRMPDKTLVAFDCSADHITWHPKGDYLLSSSQIKGSICVHQVSKARSHTPDFVAKKIKNVNCARFHPNRPLLIVSHERRRDGGTISFFDLANQALVRRLNTGSEWPVTTLNTHPSGDHVTREQ